MRAWLDGVGWWLPPGWWLVVVWERLGVEDFVVLVVAARRGDLARVVPVWLLACVDCVEKGFKA